MMDQYFGHKELYEVVLRAKTPMQFGDRYIEADEPVLYFNNVNMSLLTEQNRPIFARGGWANMPRVIWEERSEVQFQMIEGTMSSVGMSILLSANVLSNQKDKPLYIHMKEGPMDCSLNNVLQLKHWPVSYPTKKTFIFDYDRKAIQQKIYGKPYIAPQDQGKDLSEVLPRIEIFTDKNLSIPAENNREYDQAFLRETTRLYLSSGEAYGPEGKTFLRMNVATTFENVKDGINRLKIGISLFRK